MVRLVQVDQQELGGELIKEIIMRSMVKANVKKAFKMLGDLKTPITFVGKTADSFDFTTGLPVLGEEIIRTILGVETKLKREDNTIITKIIMNYEDFSDIDMVVPNLYTKVRIRNNEYKLLNPATNNGYSITLELSESTA
jgi:hypothetical protein